MAEISPSEDVEGQKARVRLAELEREMRLPDDSSQVWAWWVRYKAARQEWWQLFKWLMDSGPLGYADVCFLGASRVSVVPRASTEDDPYPGKVVVGCSMQEQCNCDFRYREAWRNSMVLWKMPAAWAVFEKLSGDQPITTDEAIHELAPLTNAGRDAAAFFLREALQWREIL